MPTVLTDLKPPGQSLHADDPLLRRWSERARNCARERSKRHRSVHVQLTQMDLGPRKDTYRPTSTGLQCSAPWQSLHGPLANSQRQHPSTVPTPGNKYAINGPRNRSKSMDLDDMYIPRSRYCTQPPSQAPLRACEMISSSYNRHRFCLFSTPPPPPPPPSTKTNVETKQRGICRSMLKISTWCIRTDFKSTIPTAHIALTV